MTKRSTFSLRSDDRAAAGVVAGIIMLGAIVAFLAYMNATWVPAWVENKESDHAAAISDAMTTWATDAEDHVSRNQSQRSWSVSLPLGVSGLPFLGTGASSGDLSVTGAPHLNISRASLPILDVTGGVAMSTHSQRYPNQTYLYAMGALQTSQPDGAYVDLRSLLTVTRTTGGEVGLTVQAINVSGAPQQVAGNGNAAIAGTLASAPTTVTPAGTTHGGSVTIQISNVQAGAWRAALNRTLTTQGLRAVSTFQADCRAISTTQNYCFTAGANNTASQAEIVLYRVSGSWSGQVSLVSVELRG